MSALYVISDLNNSKHRKVGLHTGSIDDLKSRYITAIPNLIIHYFIELPNAKFVEDTFKTKHIKDRIKNVNGNKSEWVTISLDEIMTSLLSIIRDSMDGIVMIKISEKEISRPKLKLKDNPKVDVHFKLVINDDTDDQIEFVHTILNKYTINTPGKQNVSEECFQKVLRKYIEKQTEYQVLNFLGDIVDGKIEDRGFKSYTTQCSDEDFDKSIANIMKHLNFKLTSSSLYKGLSWKKSVSKLKCISKITRELDNYPKV